MSGQTISDAKVDFSNVGVEITLGLSGTENPAIFKILKSGKFEFVFKDRKHVIKKND